MRAITPEYDSDARPSPAIEELRELLGNPGLLRALVERNIKIRYKRSVLGFAWTMINPAAMMIVLSLVFSRVFESRAPMYPAFLLPGLLLWNFFSQTTASIAAEVAAGVDLWRRVRVAKTALAIAAVITGVVNLCLAIGPLIVLLAVFRRPLGLALLTLPFTIALAGLFVLGLSLAIAAIALYFPDVADVYVIVLSAWMFATPVIYPASIIPPSIRSVLRFNPVTLYVEAFRAPLYQNASPLVSTFAIMSVVSAATLLGGWYAFTRCADEIPYRG